MKKLDWYIIRKFIGTFFFAIIILAVIACVIDYSEKASIFVKNGVPVLLIANYFKNFVPHISALLYPLFIFIATIFFTSKLAYKSEITAMLARDYRIAHATIQFELAECPADDPYCTPFARKK